VRSTAEVVHRMRLLDVLASGSALLLRYRRG
jgi:hypothetical protein